MKLKSLGHKKIIDPESLYYFKISKWKIRKPTLTLIISSLISIVLLSISIVLGLYKDYIIFSYIVIISFSIAIFPYAVYKYLESKNIKKVEEYYPKFLRDLSEALSSGMDLLHALKHVSGIYYGPLNDYIKKLYTWLSWGEDFEKSFNKFNKFFMLSYKIQQTNDIILETYKHGGDLAKVLNRISYDLDAVEDLIKLKNSYISQQVVVLYVIFLIFLGLVVVLKNSLTTMLSELSSGTSLFGTEIKTLGIDHFKKITTLTIIINGFLISFILGAVEGKRLSESFKHLILTMFISIVTILFFVLPPKINLTLDVYPKSSFIGESIKITGKITVDGDPLEFYPVSIKILSERYKTSIDTKTEDNGEFEYVFVPIKSGNYTVVVKVNINNREYKQSESFEIRDV